MGMNKDWEQLDRKISEAKAGESAHRKKPKSNERAGMQAGLEFAMCIGFGTFLGYQIDSWAGTTPIFLISLFFLGVAAGFWSVFKYSQNQGMTVGFSQLPEQEKAANKAPENELNRINPDQKEE
jgi:F0F1-type ATP synthase assembly protein I